MPLNSTWSVVVAGQWNRAILTPAGIGQIVFALPDETPVEVAVSIDFMSPHRVRHDGISVVAASDRLIIEPDVRNFTELEKSKVCAARAIADLGRTPFLAAGMNVRRIIEDPSAMLTELADDPDDGKLTGLGLNIVHRALRRGIEWKGGQINISVDRDDDGVYAVGLNFDRQSKVAAELRTFLETPINEVEEIAESIAVTYLGIDGFV